MAAHFWGATLLQLNREGCGRVVSKDEQMDDPSSQTVRVVNTRDEESIRKSDDLTCIFERTFVSKFEQELWLGKAPPPSSARASCSLP